MDPTIPKHLRGEPAEKLPLKTRLYRITNGLTKLIWLVIIVFLVVQGIFVGVKLLAKRPNERMCFDDSMCFNYCERLKQSVCLQPDRLDTAKPDEAIKLLLTGKRNIVEVLNDGQGYCACQYTNGEKRLDTFYRFYVENK